MKITISNRKDDNAVTVGCKVIGFSERQNDASPEWTAHAVYEIPDASGIAEALVDALSTYGIQYGDLSFSSVVPESAIMMAGLMDQTLASDGFCKIPYRSLTRQRDGSWEEHTRRFLSAEHVKEP